MMSVIFCAWYDFLLDLIVSPIATVMSWAMTTIATPLLEKVVPVLFDLYWKFMMVFLADWMYTGFRFFLTVLELLEQTFLIFAGVKPITYMNKSVTLLDMIFQQGVVNQLLSYVTFMALVLCFIFTIFAVTRSALDFDFENKRPVGKILGQFFKSAITFLIIPAILIFGLKLTSVVLLKTYELTSTSSESNLSTTIFLVTTVNAAKEEKYNGDKADFNSYPRVNYTTGVPLAERKTWKNILHVKADFYTMNLDWYMGWFPLYILLYVYLKVGLILIQRIFELVLLYIASPFFVAAMPLDDGELFKKWRDLFIGKLAAGFGAIISMNIYGMLMPIIIGTDFGLPGGVIISWSFKLLFLCAGALAAKQSAGMLTGIFSQAAGSQETATAGMGDSMVLHLSGQAIKFVGSNILKAPTHVKNFANFTGKAGGSFNSILKPVSPSKNTSGLSEPSLGTTANGFSGSSARGSVGGSSGSSGGTSGDSSGGSSGGSSGVSSGGTSGGFTSGRTGVSGKSVKSLPKDTSPEIKNKGSKLLTETYSPPGNTLKPTPPTGSTSIKEEVKKIQQSGMGKIGQNIGSGSGSTFTG